jgi:hypothetical protein
MSSPSPGGDVHPSNLRVALHAITFKRTDGAVEDDVKTWAQVVWLGSDGVPSDASWYATGDDALLACTSVTNGCEEAAYNYARVSKALPLSEEAVSELVASSLLVRGVAGAHLASRVKAPSPAARPPSPPARASHHAQTPPPLPLLLPPPPFSFVSSSNRAGARVQGRRARPR